MTYTKRHQHRALWREDRCTQQWQSSLAGLYIKGYYILSALDRQAIDLQAIGYGDIRCGFPGSILGSRSPSMPDSENVRVQGSVSRDVRHQHLTAAVRTPFAQ